MNFVKVKIEGNFLDSFLYSGVLFTIDINGTLFTHSFKHLINSFSETLKSSKEQTELKKFILNPSQRSNILDTNTPLEFIIEQKFLRKHTIGTELNLGFWPTDLDIKNNMIYISSEKGVEIYPFYWRDDGSVLSFEKKKILWNESKVFGVSTGSWGRTMIAAGTEGALELFNQYDSDFSEYLGEITIQPRSISNGLWIDCELNKYSTLLVLKGIDTQETLNFEKTISKTRLQEQLESKSLDEDEKSNLVNNLVSDLETCPTNLSLDNSKIIQYWLNDHTNLIHGIDKDLNKYKFDSKAKKWIELYNTDSEKDHNYNPSSIAYIREGMLFESHDSLFYSKNESTNEIEENFISWRTFPRSKNYINHVNIVTDDFLDIYAFSKLDLQD
ncbi:hypothetical protein [Acinetobacter gyllenbergii]|uniref:hypothetical protein n=1 Tax=Acinetobacter gyllenbergii TaxID=134534 RepID=UPI000806D055|nr:hypothetical protein [Acinetobacter gyllenbergii]OBY73672.1 hypothetical protein NG55_13520 [Acinetobacter gyllenbergii]